jgi:membrane fusion protein (multidrug efflux system)
MTNEEVLKMKKHWKSILIVLAVLVIAVIVIFRFNSAKKDATTPRQNKTLVKTEKPQRRSMTDQLQYNGDVAAIQQANIFSKVDGNLDRIYADIGLAVRKNQLLALIDSTDYYQRALEAQASYQNALLNYVRTKQLLEQNLLAQEDLDNAEMAMKIAAANYELAKTQLDDTRIRAPFAGYITRRYLDPGGLVTQQNAILFTLMDLETVKVTINVLEKDTPLIPKLKKATVIVDALPGEEFEGVIARYSQAIDLATRTMAVEINIANKEYVLKPGMFATATLVVSEHADAITVPTEVVLKDANGIFVFTIENNNAKRVAVQTGLQRDDRTEIINGLTGTEDIVTTGQQFLRDGSLVSIQN